MFHPLYKLTTQLLAPHAPTYLKKRTALGKEELSRLLERYGIASHNRPPGKLIWIHAASMGESRSILALVNILLKRHSDWHILVTTGTVTSARMLAHELPARAFHQYIPLDVPRWVNSFLQHWQPNFVVWVEQELWPNMLESIHTRQIPAILANGRLNESSYRRWRFFKPMIRKMLLPFHAIYAQSKYDGQRYAELSGRDVITRGNLKYASLPLPFNEAKLEELKKAIGERPIWLAASTHLGEEELIAKAHQLILQEKPNALLILIPRHANRGPKIAAELKELKLSIARREADEKITDRTQVYLADTMGELGTFYRLANIAFLGGSLVTIGGHNLIEPAQFGCVTIYGPHMNNNQEIIEQFATHSIGYQIETTRQIADLVLHLLNDPDHIKRIGQTAKDFVAKQGQILDELIVDIESTLK